MLIFFNKNIYGSYLKKKKKIILFDSSCSADQFNNSWLSGIHAYPVVGTVCSAFTPQIHSNRVLLKADKCFQSGCSVHTQVPLTVFTPA